MNRAWQSQIVNDEVSGDGTPSGGGAPSAPVVPPVVAPVEPPAADEGLSASSNVEWDDVADDDLIGDDEPPKVVTPESTPPAPEPREVLLPKPDVPVAVVPAPAEPPPSTPTPPAPPPVSAEEIQKQVREGREKFVKQLETLYAVSEADLPTLVAEPEKVLPGMFAKAHAAIMDQVANYVQTALPQLIQATQVKETQVASSLKQFYSAWPELSDPKYSATVARQLVAYRQANPEAKTEDVIHEGGVSALIALRLPIPERLLKVHNAGTPSATPSVPFSPVSAGSAPSAPSQPGPTNAFTILAQEDLAESS